MKSRYRGTCKCCKDTIYVGDEIWNVTNLGGWVHVSCAKNPPKTEATALPPASEYQQPILDWLEFGAGHALVDACPGSGKTTTLKMVVHRIREFQPKAKIKVVAFNSPIAAEIDAELEGAASVSTFHSWGFNMEKQVNKGIKCSKENKLWELVKNIFPLEEGITKDEKKLVYKRRRVYRALAGKMKGTLLSPVECITRFGIDVDGIDFDPNIAQNILTIGYMDKTRCDFDDMVWMAFMDECSENYDWILLDEVQDVNPVMLELAMFSVKGKTRVIGVGDRFQSIYAWRGAHFKMMELLEERLNATSFNLPVTYRCPQIHVDYINTRIPGANIICGRPDAPGELDFVPYDKIVDLIKPDDHTIICRRNAPLIKLAYELIAAGKAATVLGRDISKGLLDLISKVPGGPTQEAGDLTERLSQYVYKRCKKMGGEDNQNTALIEGLHDKLECIRVVAYHEETRTGVVDRINAIFSESVKGIPLMSIHKCKGKTFTHCVILEEDQLPFKSQNEEEAQQEENCMRVALSRSNSKLTCVFAEERE